MNMNTLNTLPETEFICGMGEVLKTGLICDSELFRSVCRQKKQIRGLDSQVLASVIQMCIRDRDKLLPVYKLYRLEHALEEVQQEKIWLKSGGFLVIQQTEAFASIDVNRGKYTGKKKAEETYRKINLEASEEIARQIRLRNLSGIILIDFINMQNPDHQDELFHVLQKYLRKDQMCIRDSAGRTEEAGTLIAR